MTDAAGEGRVEEIRQRHAREIESTLLGDNTYYDDIGYLLARLRAVEAERDAWMERFTRLSALDMDAAADARRRREALTAAQDVIASLGGCLEAIGAGNALTQMEISILTRDVAKAVAAMALTAPRP